MLGALTVQGDSKLVISQVSGVWKVNAANLRPLHAEAARLLEQLAALGPGGCELDTHPARQERGRAPGRSSEPGDGRRGYDFGRVRCTMPGGRLLTQGGAGGTRDSPESAAVAGRGG